jgi:hypothetical protein
VGQGPGNLTESELRLRLFSFTSQPYSASIVLEISLLLHRTRGYFAPMLATTSLSEWRIGSRMLLPFT